MATRDIKDWYRNPSSLAIHVTEASSAFWSRGITIPRGVAGLIYFEGGKPSQVLEEKSYNGPFRAVLIKTSPIQMEFSFEKLYEKNKLELSFTASLALRFGTADNDIEALEDSLLKDSAELSLYRFQAVVEPVIEDAAKAFASERKAAELVGPGALDEFARHLRTYKAFKRIQFQCGLALPALEQLRISCPEYEDGILAKKLKAAEKARKLEEHERKLLEMRYQEEEKKRREELVRGGIAEEQATMQAELDARMSMISKLKEHGFDIEKIADDEVKDKLLSWLEPPSKKHRLHPVAEGATTRRLFAAVGKTVVAYDPNADPSTANRPRETHDFGDRELGYVRSVRVDELNDEQVLLAGAQGGVYLVRLDKPDEVREFTFPKAGKSRSGANAAAIVQGALYATHSDYGLVRWSLEEDGAKEILFPEYAENAKSVRGVQNDGSGHVVFAADATAFRFDPSEPESEPVAFKGNSREITSIIATPEHIYAGTTQGNILEWSLEDPASPHDTGLLWKSKIYKMSLLPTRRGDALVVGVKLYRVPTAVLGAETRVDYQCGCEKPMRWVESAPDFIFGVSDAGYTVFVWKMDFPSRPALEIRTAEKIRDITVLTG
ncbi:MAG: hypothetical protein ACYS8W_09005 [Planctomycetota bacterium]|jgi:hypothetical protein